MPEWLLFIIVPLAAYLIGGVPFALILGKWRGVDVRRHGSGNVGATNLARLLGRNWGVLCFALDFGKGALALGLAMAASPQPVGSLLPVLTAAAVVAGHVWPLALGFKGGKGVATTLGALLVLAPWAMLIAAAVWLVAFQASRYVSLASLLAAASLPAAELLLGLFGRTHRLDRHRLLLLALLALFIVWRHRDNLKRLVDGTEPRFARKKRD